ncbi:helix-turn-helix transcriptional regulator [Streptococcus suis]|uniref:helix-turn-helix domain-containing protein n=1 Tax=Streptococcus suis TaxID=1307 RepID=UPI00240D3AF5|nr:helix-turn-helix transcriptional regulator [Streptococcus suis]WFA75375.1 helix-turn-helix transcriptional regulator [Streptococcus suis]
MATFTERLKELRKKNNLTQRELADMLGVSQGSYANWENGKREPNLARLGDIAIYFNTSIDYLTGKIDKEYDEITTEEIKQMSDEEVKESSKNAISNILLTLSVGKLKGIPKAQMISIFNTEEHKDIFPHVEALINKVYSDKSSTNSAPKETNSTDKN